MAEPATDLSLVGRDRLDIEARLTGLEVTNKHILATLRELKEALSDIANEVSEMRGELKAKNDSNGNGSVLRYVVIALVSALLSLVGVKLAGGM